MRPSSKATINDVASLAGVSIKTVSRVVNDEPNVRSDTRERVERAIAQLRYRPNVSARNLASAKARLFALIYDDQSAYAVPSAGYIIKMQDGALKACRESSYELLIHPCRYRENGIEDEIRQLIEGIRPAGVIIAAPLSNVEKIVNAVRATATPFVRVSPGRKSRTDLAVATNDREFSAEMTGYLASLGHRRIAFIAGDSSHRAVANRLKGFRDGLEQAGIAFDDGLVADGDNSLKSGERCAAHLLQRKRRPTAIFAANDDMAAGVIRTARRKGLRIPEDLSVAGCDDIALASQICPSLTTIHQPLYAMAEKAVSDLIEFGIRGDGETAHFTVVPASIVVRESTGPAPG